MQPSVTYLHIRPEASLPLISDIVPSRMVVMVEAEVSAAWQSRVSDWIVGSGCLYMMAWGYDCSTWDDAVDMANIAKFQPAEIPENHFVITTWHADEPLSEVFWFAKNNAVHPTVALQRTVLLHIAAEQNEQSLLAAYYAA